MFNFYKERKQLTWSAIQSLPSCRDYHNQLSFANKEDTFSMKQYHKCFFISMFSNAYLPGMADGKLMKLQHVHDSAKVMIEFKEL